MLSKSKFKKIVKDFLPPIVFRLVTSALNLNRKYKGLYQLDKKKLF